MNDINIPVSIVGPGSQPAEADGVEMDILNLPSGMDTYEKPILPEPEDVSHLNEGKRLLRLLHVMLKKSAAGKQSESLDVTELDEVNRHLVDQVLGEGEVSIVFELDAQVKIQESVLAGVWRVKHYDQSGVVTNDYIEVGSSPSIIKQRSFEGAGELVNIDTTLPEGVFNAPSLLTEINEQIPAYEVGDESHVINLTLLPQTEKDLEYLAEQLGQGWVTILSRGYGNCRITSTATKNVWWVQYFNSQDKNILNTLEVVDVPVVACAAQEDISDSAERLSEIMEIYL